MASKLAQAQDAAVGFVKKLRPEDRGAVLEFNDTIQVGAPLTEDPGELEAAIRRMAARGRTSLYTAIYVALKSFTPSVSRAGTARRRALVVLSDGSDTTSLVHFEDVLDLVRRQGVSVYIILLTSTYEATQVRATGSPAAQEAFALTKLARESGGQRFLFRRIEQLDDVYGAILDELSTQYTIGYQSSNTSQDGAFRRVGVQVLAPGQAASVPERGRGISRLASDVPGHP